MLNGKWGRRLMVGVMIFVPLEKIGVAGLGPADLFAVILLIATLVLSWRHNREFHFPLALAMWMIFIGSLVGSLSGLAIFTALFALLQEAYLYSAFLGVANAIIDRNSFNFIGKVWACVGIFESALLVLGRFGLKLPFLSGGGGGKASAVTAAGGDPNALLEDIGRATGTFSNANAAGGYMVIAFFVFLAMDFPRNRFLRLGFSLMFIFAILTTGSNAALGGMLVGLAATILIWIYERGRAMMLAMGAGAVAIAVIALSLPVASAYLATLPKDSPLHAFARVDDKLDKRLDIWSTGWDLYTLHPLGIGSAVTPTILAAGLHNDYVAFLVERGPLGEIGLFLLFGEMFYWVGLALRRGKTWDHHRTTAALLGGLLGTMVIAAAHETTHGRPLWLLFAFMFVHYKLLRQETAEVEAKKAQPARRAIAVGKHGSAAVADSTAR